MGLFDWGAKKKERERLEKVERLRTAATAIQAELPDTTPFSIGRVAGQLIGLCHSVSARELNDAAIMAGGVFCISAARSFTIGIGENNDEAWRAAFFIFLRGDKPTFERFHNRVKGEWDRLFKVRDEFLLDKVSGGIILWFIRPDQASVEHIAKLYETFLDGPGGASANRMLAPAMRAAMASVGYTPPDYYSPIPVGMAAGHLINDMVEILKPDKSDPDYRFMLCMYALTLTHFFASIHGVNGNGAGMSAMSAVMVDKNQTKAEIEAASDIMVAAIQHYANKGSADDMVMKRVIGTARRWIETPNKDAYVKMAVFFGFFVQKKVPPPIAD